MALPARGPGRPPGAPNKYARRFGELIEEMGFNAAEQFVWIYSEAKENYQKNRNGKMLHIALVAASEIASYCYPKLKSVEHQRGEALEGMTVEQKIEALKQAQTLLELQLKTKEIK